MALAIVFGEMIEEGKVESYAELAKLGGVSRARISQIMSFAVLAPDLQVGLLCDDNRLPERAVRASLCALDWGRQRKFLTHSTPMPPIRYRRRGLAL
jgi:alkylated DNA nucleotide flippase Atl1